ncbi:MAG: S-layer family protein [Microcoleus vaginatus WJT46-NPBG5]|nr:S-layer family protein [Microcoleus vaginatus WJT46-NPBG5]
MTIIFLSDRGTAQIIPDATLPMNSTVTQQGTTSVIEGGTRAGSNLFHSFQQFSIPTNQSATFNNTVDVQNILTRITGSSISNIDGGIQAKGTANLFLINPKGIVFGPNAQLNIGGSFLASTASQINFADGTQFSAVNPQTPLLTVSVPIGLQMGTKQSLFPNVQTPGAIVVQGSNLSVQTGKTLALVGGNVTIFGSNNPLAPGLVAGGIPITMVNENLVPTTPGGRIELGSVTDGNIMLTPTDKGFALGYSSIQKFGDIQLKNNATVNTSGMGGGEIQIQARNLQVSSGSSIVSFTLGSLSGGDITVNASDSVELIGTGRFVETLQQIASGQIGPSDFRNGLFTISFGEGNAGNIEINTSRFTAHNGAFTVASTIGAGRGGAVRVNATGSTEVNNSGLITGNRPGSTGAAGDITINTRSLLFENLGLAIAGTAGEGAGGAITVNAAETAEFIGDNNFELLGVPANTGLFTSTLSAADAGNIKIKTRRLIVQNWASIAASVSEQGKGGTIDIDASESVDVIGRTGSPFAVLTISAITLPESTGVAGDLNINTNTLHLRDGVAIVMSSYGEGNAGNININARSIYLDNLAFLNADTRSVNTNSNEVQATINLRSHSLILRRGSAINTNAQGQNVIGGNINIQSNVLAALENSDITANSQESQGGTVTINTQGIFGPQFRQQLTPASDITASGGSPELTGTVTLNTPDLDPSQGLLKLPENPVDATRLIASTCRRGKEQSEFNVTGRGGLPPHPYEAIADEATWIDLRPAAGERTSSLKEEPKITTQDSTASSPQLIEAQGWIINSKGQVELVAQVPAVSPHNPGFPQQQCPLN